MARLRLLPFLLALLASCSPATPASDATPDAAAEAAADAINVPDASDDRAAPSDASADAGSLDAAPDAEVLDASWSSSRSSGMNEKSMRPAAESTDVSRFFQESMRAGRGADGSVGRAHAPVRAAR